MSKIDTYYCLNALKRPIEILVLFLFLSFPSYAIHIGENDHYLFVNGKKVDVLLDDDKKFTIQNLPHSKFKKFEVSTLNFGFYQGVVWLKLNVKSKKERGMLLEIKNPLVDKAEIYLKNQKGNYQKIATVGDQYTFSSRKINHRVFHVNVKIPGEIIIRFSNFGDQLYTPLYLMDKKGLATRDVYGQILWGFYFGIMLLILTFVYAVYHLQKNKSFLYYIGYIIAMMLVQSTFSGLGRQYIYGDFPMIINRLTPLFGCLSTYFMVLFLQHFIETKKFVPLYNSGLEIIKYFLYFDFVLLLIPGQIFLQIGAMLITILILVAAVLPIPIVYIRYKRGFKAGFYLLVSFGILLLSVMVYVGRSFGLLPNSILTEYSLQIGSGIEAGFIALAIVREFKSHKDEAAELEEKIKELKKNETKKLEFEVSKRSKEIEEQKLELVQLNSQLFNSIDYARKIQESIIPSEEKFISHFGKGFVLYKPKDLVSGDFYWAATLATSVDGKREENVVFSIGDCTGHGVSGAMLSIVALRILNNSRFEKKINSARSFLEYSDSEFSAIFQGEDSKRNFHEGMDLVMCVFNPNTYILEFSGARNGCILIRNEEIKMYRGNKKSIGWVLSEENYVQTNIQLQKGDRIYFTTDGFTDQFGGEKDKKLKLYRLLEFLNSIQHVCMDEQKNLINVFFEDWKGQKEQTDDVCLVGIEV